MKSGLAHAFVVLAVWAWCATAHAEALPFSTQLPLGRPAKTIGVQAINTPDGVELTIGTARHMLKHVAATEVEVEGVVLAGGGAVGVVSIRAGAETHLALVGKRAGKLSVLWSGISGLRGDPGERRGYNLLRADRDGDGRPEVGIGETHEAVRGCDGTPASVRARWINPSTLELDAPTEQLTLPQDAGADQAVHLDATPNPPPGQRNRPLLQVLRARWSTSTETGDELSALPTGGILLDGNREVAWTDGGARNAAAALAVLGSGLRVTHVALTVASPSAGETGALLVRGDDSRWFHVTLPGAPATDGRYWVTMPEPVAWTCIQLAVAPATAAGKGMPAITEIEAFTELDGPDGLSRLVARVITDDQHGSDAASLLMSLGDNGIVALRNHWEALGARGQRRAVVAFGARAGDSAAARAALMQGAAGPDPDVSGRALAALVQNAGVAFAELAELAASAGPVGETAAQAIGQSGAPEAVTVLLRLIGAPGGADRSALRDALSAAMSRSTGTVTDTAVAAWIESAPPTPAFAAALLAMTKLEPAQPEALALWTRLSTVPLEFPDVWRTILATRSLGPSDDVDAWLVAQVAGEGVTWMLRDAALSSLFARGSARAIGAAQGARNDDSPRVRATAIGILGRSPEQRPALAASLSTEVWPLARATLIQHVAGVPDAPQILRRALRDHAVPVRIAAIDALLRSGDRSSWPLLAERLADNNESPAVMSAAIQFAAALCITEATDGLRPVLRRGLKPDTWAPDVDLALEAIAALGHLGTDDAHGLLRALQSADQPAMVRDTAKRAAGTTACGTGAEPTSSPDSN